MSQRTYSSKELTGGGMAEVHKMKWGPGSGKRWEKMKNPGGRQDSMDEATLKKLEDAFMLGCTDEMACIAANISKPTLYKYCKRHPAYTEYKEMLKSNLPLKALMLANKAINDSLTGKKIDSTTLQMAYKIVQRKVPGYDEKNTQDINVFNISSDRYAAEIDSLNKRIMEIEGSSYKDVIEHETVERVD